MGEAEWLAVGLVIGVLIGLPLGWMLFQLSQPKQAPQQQAKAASVVFDRDEAGRITGIHYVPA
jgi:Na+/glutamate symporter